MKFAIACMVAVVATAKHHKGHEPGHYVKKWTNKLKHYYNNINGECTVPQDVTWIDATCRMRELCGTGCEEGECKWQYGAGQTQDDASCACKVCKTEVSAAPTVATQWKADAVQDMEGNIPGVRPGKTNWTAYYDYPTRHRYQYETYDVVYDFTAQKAYKIKANGKCCYKADTDAMIEIAPTNKAKDMGPKDNGEEWQQKLNLIYMKETTDFIITSDNTVAEWDQDIAMGKDGSEWMTVDVSYTNTVVGGLTDADFLTDKTADCSSTCVMSEEEELWIMSGWGWPHEPLEGFDDPCEVPTAKNWGEACRMRELCGTGCAEGECKWHWEQDDMSDAACGCHVCEAADFLQ